MPARTTHHRFHSLIRFLHTGFPFAQPTRALAQISPPEQLLSLATGYGLRKLFDEPFRSIDDLLRPRKNSASDIPDDIPKALNSRKLHRLLHPEEVAILFRYADCSMPADSEHG